MAKISDAFKGTIGGLRNIAELGSHIHTAAEIVGAVTGKKEPADDAPAAVKGLHGVLGHADERAFLVNLNQLDQDDQEAILGFFQWCFDGINWTEKMAAWWGANELRTFIAKMGSSSGEEIGKRTSRRKWKSGKDNNIDHVAITRSSIRSKGRNNALDFMEWMAKVIHSEPDRTEGFKKLKSELERRNVPFGRSGVQVASKLDAKLAEAGNAFDDGIYHVADAVETNTLKRKWRDRNARWFTRGLTKIGTWGLLK